MKLDEILHKQRIVLYSTGKWLLRIMDNKNNMTPVLLNWQLSNLAQVLHYLHHSYYSCAGFINCCDPSLDNLSATIEEISHEPWHIENLQKDAKEQPLEFLIERWIDLKNHSQLSFVQ